MFVRVDFDLFSVSGGKSPGFELILRRRLAFQEA